MSVISMPGQEEQVSKNTSVQVRLAQTPMSRLLSLELPLPGKLGQMLSPHTVSPLHIPYTGEHNANRIFHMPWNQPDHTSFRPALGQRK